MRNQAIQEIIKALRYLREHRKWSWGKIGDAIGYTGASVIGFRKGKLPQSEKKLKLIHSRITELAYKIKNMKNEKL